MHHHYCYLCSHGDIHSHKLSRKQEDLRNKQVRASAYLRNSPNIITQITSTTATSNDPDKMEIENSFGEYHSLALHITTI